MHKILPIAHTKRKQPGGGLMFSSFLPGLINGLLGTGGGILAVSILNKQGFSQNQAHATAVTLMLPLSAISLATLLLQMEGMRFLQYWPLLFPAILGSVVGSRILKKIRPQRLRLLFAVLILYSAFRILST